jgi:Family of unknown function (DUF6502)
MCLEKVGMPKPKPVTQQKNGQRNLATPTNHDLRVGLLQELHHIVLDVGTALGVSLKDRHRAIELAKKDTRRLRPSQTVTEPISATSRLLKAWRRDKRYTRPDGTPRVLSITGKGPTLESLARQHVPTIPVDQLADMICQNADVMRLKDNTVALVGSTVLIMPKTSEMTLAALVVRFRRLSENLVHNVALPADVQATGRFERLVTGVLSENNFRKFARSVRPQLQDLCDRVDAAMQEPNPNGKLPEKGKKCGIHLYVFRDDGKIG